MSSSVSLLQGQVTSLVKILFELKNREYTGLVKVCTEVRETQAKLECYLLLNKGFLAWAERAISGTDSWVAGILRRLKVKCVDQVMQYAANRIDISSSSPYQVLETIVSTRLVKWEDLERAITDRMVIILEQFMPYPCTIVPLPLEFDMTYASNFQGIDCSSVLQKIEQRQSQWKQYLVALNSVHAIPYIKDGAISIITHEPTKQHLQKWVDGKRSFAEIAEALEQDPLILAPFYLRWVNEGLIDFNFGVSELEKLPVILSVDDSPIVQAMIRRTLCESYEVISASSAMEALGILNRRQVDLILLDVTMPEIDGFEFCSTIRKMSKFKNTPVIMLTAKDGLIDRARGHMAGTNRYLTKPVNKEELLKAIQEYI
jgi:CheY-like chemotaxis protein